MADRSPALSVAQPMLAAIAETSTALRTAVKQFTTDLQAIEKDLVATGPVIEFLLWEPIRQTERRFVGEGETRATDTAWCLALCRTRPGGTWRLVVREYQREFDPVATQAPVRMVRSEIPIIEADAELQLAAMDHVSRFLESLHDTLRQTLAASQAHGTSKQSRVSRSQAPPPAAHHP